MMIDTEDAEKLQEVKSKLLAAPAGRPMRKKYMEVFERTVRAQAFSAGSRTTLDAIYRGCPDESVVLFIGQLIQKKPTLSPADAAAREKAIAAAHAWADRAGLSFAKKMKPEPLI